MLYGMTCIRQLCPPGFLFSFGAASAATWSQRRQITFLEIQALSLGMDVLAAVLRSGSWYSLTIVLVVVVENHVRTFPEA